jgi:hypothetical protein
MSQTEPVQPIKPAQYPYPVAVIEGKIVAVHDGDNQDYYEIGGKAPDEYSLPPVWNIASTKKLGRVGDFVKILCRVGGYPRKGANGGRFVVNTLSAIDR